MTDIVARLRIASFMAAQEAADEIERLRAELEVSEAVNRAKTELLMDVSMMLSDGELTPTQRVLNAGTAIVVRTGPPRTKNRPQDVREIVAALDHQQRASGSEK